jgi:HEPN domain-containing protein
MARLGRLFEWACFGSQQAAEKALKAVFAARGEDAWGHSVRELLEALLPDAPAALLDAARELDRCYIPTRYPNGFDRGAPKDHFGESDADRTIAGAEQILGLCDGLLPGP